MKRLSSFLSLFTSTSTIVCCALPAFFVVIGAGASFAGLVGTFPQLIWLSENKLYLFVAGGILLVVAGVLQWRARNEACPVDPKLGEACTTTRDWSKWVYLISVGLYLVGFSFAYIFPLLMG